jgi:hypothetical protein
MIHVNTPHLSFMGENPHASGDTQSPIYGPGRGFNPQPPIISHLYTATPVNQISPPPAPEPPIIIHAPTTPAQVVPVPTSLTNAIDPVTGLSYSGNLTQDAQTLENAGNLVNSANQLTSQGSALAAQGDLIVGTPAPTAASAVSASITPTSTDSWTSFMAWLSAETVWAGIPNGAVLAGGVLGAALLFGGKKGRR